MKAPEWNLNNVPEWARAALDEALNQPSQPSVLDYRDTAAWPLLVDAAIVSSFLPKDLASEERAEAEKAVLKFSETTYGPDGVQWTLTQESRSQIVEAALTSGELQRAIERTASKFNDNLSRALRNCVSPEITAWKELDLKSLETLRIAVAALVGVSPEKLKLPSLADLDREIAYRRLIAQFERMTRKQPVKTGSEKDDRFFGRDEELTQLDNFVAQKKTESAFSSVKRAIGEIARKFIGAPPLAVWGVGGAGKTTLISKFMLDNAEVASKRFPFAYLDFDRTSLGARQRLGLLAEMCVQVGAQFEAMTAPMTSLEAEIRRLVRDLESKNQVETISELGIYCLKFRAHVDALLESLESTFELARPFLLVFDTFEMVQLAQGDSKAKDSLTGLEQFVQCFTKTDETGMWPRLRLIISGRQQIKAFLGTVEDLKVGALDPPGSAQLLVALAKDAGKPITNAEAEKLVATVAKVIKEPNSGVQPLTLHLIGEVFRKTKGGGKGIVESLIDEIEQPLKAGGVAATTWIHGILHRRILDPVADVRVKALANPGLVVRRITPEVIRKVMTRATSKPVNNKPVADSDGDVLEPWDIDGTEAESIFKSFKNEVSLVEDDGVNALRHRPDVRQQMLPLIRAQWPKRFEALNRIAFDYFSERAEKDEKDLSAAAEAIYHGLWLNEPLERLNKFWRDSQAFAPRIDPKDFDEGSPAHIYVRAKDHTPLTATEIAQLPCDVALEWLDARSADLLNDHRVDEAVEAIRAAAGEDFAALDNRTATASVLARLLYRAGLWQEAADLVSRHTTAKEPHELAGPDDPNLTERDSRAAALLSMVRTLATIVGKSAGSNVPLVTISRVATLARDPMVRVELAAHAILAYAPTAEGRSQNQDFDVKGLWNLMLGVPPDRWQRDKKVLRLAILSYQDTGVVSETSDYDPSTALITIWIEASERVPRDVDSTLIGYLLSHIFLEGDAARYVEDIVSALKSLQTRRGALNRLDQLWRAEKPRILSAVQRRADLRPLMRAVIAADNSDWVRPVGNSLTRALKAQDGAELLKSLEKARFRISAGKRDQDQEADGIAVVQYAMDDGRLLELAETLIGWKEKNRPRSGDSAETYPQDVFAISRALLNWHTRLQQGDQGISWEDAPQLESRLKRSLDTFDWQSAEATCKEIIDRTRKAKDKIPEATAKRLMNALRRKRRFTLMTQLAEAILTSGVRTPQVRRQYAQALIDQGQLGEAETVLESIIADPASVPVEVVEARGLTARIYKQRYVDKPEGNADNLLRALTIYHDVYALNPKENLWHGINVVACVRRARRDGIPSSDLPDESALAFEILSTLEEKELQSAVDLPAFDQATRMEAFVALDRYSDADAAALTYIDSIDVDAFELRSTIRQLTEVWLLDSNEPPGNHLLPILKAAHLSKEGAFSDRKVEEVAEEAISVGAAVDDLEAIFGSTRTVTLRWYKKGLDQCNAVARIEKFDKGLGTGWLVKASDFFPDREGVLLLTNAHVIPGAVLPEDAVANFQSLGEKIKIKEIVWSSPIRDLDATFVSLEAAPKAAPLVLHERAVEMTQPPNPSPRLYIIGHPQGRDVEFSIQDNHLIATNETLLHYRTPTEPGSSGSPVFESDDWRVVALHHRGSDKLNRIDGTRGTYKANEGISIRAIKAKTQAIKA